jgi:hypothetical protein
MNMKRPSLLLCVAGLTAIAVAVWLYDAAMYTAWVGHTDLQVEFVATDVVTNQPIEGAKIEIQSEGGFFRERNVKQFTLVTDGNGSATSICHDSMCFGTRSGFGWMRDSFAVHLPEWRADATAPGYGSSETIEIETLENRRKIERLRPGARLVVPISLHRSVHAKR